MNMITSKVKRRIKWILRTFQTNTAEFGKFMWKSYIQGLLDYGSQIWAPIQITQLQMLELLPNPSQTEYMTYKIRTIRKN